MQNMCSICSTEEQFGLSIFKFSIKKTQTQQITTVGLSDFNAENEVMCKHWVLRKREIRSTHLVEE